MAKNAKKISPFGDAKSNSKKQKNKKTKKQKKQQPLGDQSFGLRRATKIRIDESLRIRRFGFAKRKGPTRRPVKRCNI